MQSSSISAWMRRTFPCAKLRSSVAFKGFLSQTALIGVRVTNIPHESTKIVVVFDKFLAQSIEQLRIARWITHPNIIHWLHDSLAEKMRPHSVGYTRSEQRVVGGS